MLHTSVKTRKNNELSKKIIVPFGKKKVIKLQNNQNICIENYN
jgi:predicted nucleic-acid-binding Zn-ribbon protein